MKLGIALGAGGPFGWAFHVGVAEGLSDVFGRELSEVDRVVGTSAGGAIAASLFSGASTTEVLEVVCWRPSGTERAEMKRRKNELARHPLRRLRPQDPFMLRLGGVRGLVGLLPEGVFPTFPLRRFPTAGLDQWPEALWMPSVRLGDGETVVFGRDRTDVSVDDAIEATSAVPGMFQPKTIGDDRYIDGAVASATHVDLFANGKFDLVVVASPMTRPGGGLVRERARRQLNREVAAVERSGARAVVIHPNEAIVDLASGFPRVRPEVGADIVSAARNLTVESLNTFDRRFDTRLPVLLKGSA